MNSQSSPTLLSVGDPPPFQIHNPDGASPFLLIGDHAGNVVPGALDRLGLNDAELGRHIGWDIGIAGLGVRLAEALGAVFIRQTYSRLVIDCNREPGAPDAMPEVSDKTLVPANQGLGEAARAARVDEIHAPYHAAIASELARRDAAGIDTILVALHSFTPAMQGVPRPWQIGILHSGGDASFALALLRGLRERGDLTVGDNQPYAMDGIDYTVPRHAFEARRRYAEIEIRQDLLATGDQQAGWSELLAVMLTAAGLRAE